MSRSITLIVLLVSLYSQNIYAKVVPGQYKVTNSGIIQLFIFSNQLKASLLQWGDHKGNYYSYNVEARDGNLYIYSEANASLLNHKHINKECPIILRPVDHALDSDKETTKYRYHYGEILPDTEPRYATKFDAKI